MRGCLFTLLLAIVVGILLVVVALPAAAAGVLTGAVEAAGLQASAIGVTVTSDPPTDLLGLTADDVRIRATRAAFHGLAIGSLDIRLHRVALLGLTVQDVSGAMDQVSVPDVGGQPLTLPSVILEGSGGQVTATAVVPAAQADALVLERIAAALGVRPSSVALVAPDQVVVRALGVAVSGSLRVTTAGDVVATITSGPQVGQALTLLAAGSGLPIRVTSATVTPTGDLRIDGTLNIGLLG